MLRIRNGDGEKMTIPVEINGRVVPVSGPDGLLEKAVEAAAFKNWVKGLDPRFIVNTITIQAVDMFGPRVGFLKFNADVVDGGGNPIPGAVFMRGGAVAVLVILECEGREYVLLTSQARLPVGVFEYEEIPAGMIDNSGTFSGAAAKEIKEETGIEIETDSLIDLTAMYTPDALGAYPSVGGCDEFIRLFLYRKEVTQETLEELQGRLGGLEEEWERISLVIIPFTNAFARVTDMKFLSCAALYMAAKQERRL